MKPRGQRGQSPGNTSLGTSAPSALGPRGPRCLPRASSEASAPQQRGLSHSPAGAEPPPGCSQPSAPRLAPPLHRRLPRCCRRVELQRQPRAIPLSREGFGRVSRATRFCRGRLPAALLAIYHAAMRCFHKNIFTTFSLLPQDFSLNPRQVAGKYTEQVQDRICTLKTSIS